MLKYDSIKKVYEDNGFKFISFENIEDMKTSLMAEIGLDEKVDFGGSMTLFDLGIYEDLESRGQDLYWHWKHREKTRQGSAYLTSSNAITRDGKIVNIDGTGNRITSMVYGYENVYIIVGKNKLVKNYEEAIERIKNIAAPLNAKRLKLNTPCVKTGRCMDCNSPERICRAETIIHKNPGQTQIHIYLIEEDLGY